MKSMRVERVLHCDRELGNLEHEAGSTALEGGTRLAEDGVLEGVATSIERILEARQGAL
jgi:hypothetical protein